MTKRFKSVKTFELFLKKRGKAPDIVKIGKIIYTMDEYDSSGKEVHYGNKRTGMSLIVETSNRYGPTKYKDAKVEEVNLGFYRNDISYVD